MSRLAAFLLALPLLCACTSTAQVRGTGPADRLIDLEALAASRPGVFLVTYLNLYLQGKPDETPVQP